MEVEALLLTPSGIHITESMHSNTAFSGGFR